MDAKVLTQWLADLRSGEFSQTTRNLRDGCGFCCLGVLASRFADEWIGGSFRMVPKRNGKHISGSDSDCPSDHSGFLGGAFMKEIGLDEGLAGDGMFLNDRKVPFPKIADFIEDWYAKKAAGQNPAELLNAENFAHKVLRPLGYGAEV